jgi:hypothetical protein
MLPISLPEQFDYPEHVFAAQELIDIGRRGYMLVDPGATSHVSGLDAAEGLREAVRKAGLGACEFDRNLTRDFTFGDGKSLCTTGTAFIPAVLSGRSINLPVSILDARSPPLLGVNILNECGAIVDFGQDPGIWFTGLDGPKQPCIRLPTGHLAVRIVPAEPTTSSAEPNDAVAIVATSRDDLSDQKSGSLPADSGNEALVSADKANPRL